MIKNSTSNNMNIVTCTHMCLLFTESILLRKFHSGWCSSENLLQLKCQTFFENSVVNFEEKNFGFAKAIWVNENRVTGVFNFLMYSKSVVSASVLVVISFIFQMELIIIESSSVFYPLHGKKQTERRKNFTWNDINSQTTIKTLKTQNNRKGMREKKNEKKVLKNKLISKQNVEYTWGWKFHCYVHY